jgi:DNA-directed RNA polymerase specialized sigma24 family protein
MQRPDRELIEGAVRAALRRGVPAADAEDIAVSAWEKASASFVPARGEFGALYQRVVQTAIVDWWRQIGRRRETPSVSAWTLPAPVPSSTLEDVMRNQERLLAALTEDERRVFATWALQKHLPQGGLTAERAAASLRMSTADYENAKRRLKAQILRLAEQWQLAPADFFSCVEGEGPRRKHAHG